MNSSRKTIGIRVPDHTIVRQLIETLDAPLLGSSFKAPGADFPFTEPGQFEDDFKHALAGIIRCNQACSTTGTTVVDLSNTVPEVIRVGKSDPQTIGL